MSTPTDIIVYSLTTSKALILQAIQGEQCQAQHVLCLSPHKAFDTEIEEIQSCTTKQLSFASFYEFISQEEMEFCDADADRVILQKHGTRARRMHAYYAKIKELKNQVILTNIRQTHEVSSGYVLANDLGIAAAVWTQHGFGADYLPSETASDCIMRHIRTFISRTHHALNANRQIAQAVSDNQTYIFVGNPARIAQYLDPEKVKIEPMPMLQKALLFLLFSASGLLIDNIVVRAVRNLMLSTIALLYRLIPKERRALPILSPIHEDSDWFGIGAEKLGVEMIYMQDGFLPSYYPSAYLKYRVWATKYFIWDKLSAGIFERHSLLCEIWPCYKGTALARVEERAVEVRNIVVLTSGSGDWTALKNRSDEDLAFLAFVDVARRLPDVSIIYRPHPLWMHPEHQGVNSIRRLADYASQLGLPNFRVSSGALKEGGQFVSDGQMSVKPTTIKEELASADIVFGDHSQALLRAAQTGKLCASVSLARRREFLYDYTKLGFPILRSSDEIVDFIQGLARSDETIRKFNEAVDLYNSEYTT